MELKHRLHRLFAEQRKQLTEKNEQLKQQRVQLDLQHVLLREQQRMLDDQDAQLRQLRYLKLLEDQRGVHQMQREEEEE